MSALASLAAQPTSARTSARVAAMTTVRSGARRTSGTPAREPRVMPATSADASSPSARSSQSSPEAMTVTRAGSAVTTRSATTPAKIAPSMAGQRVIGRRASREYDSRQVAGNDPVGAIDDLADAQVRTNAAQHVGVLRTQAPGLAEQVDHV